MKRIVSLFLMLALILSLSAGVAEEKTVIHFWHCHSGAVAESHQFLVDKFNASQDKIISFCYSGAHKWIRYG